MSFETNCQTTSLPAPFVPQAFSAAKPLRAGRERLLQFASVALALACASCSLAHAQAASQSGSGAAASQYSGVSTPPANDAIVANDDAIAEPAAQPNAKPSPGVAASTTLQPSVAARNNSASGENADYGIVTSTADTQPPPATVEERNAHLVSRPQNPDYGVIGMVASPSNQLAEGTDIRVRLLQPLSTLHSQDGEEFRAQVAKDVYKEGRVVIPMGSELRGRVVGVTQGHRLGAHATLRLRPDDIILPDGTAYHLYAQAIASGQPGTHTDQEGGIQPSAHIGKDLSEFGGGAGGGAAVGAVLGGPIGAGAGAIVGTGLVTTHLLLQKPNQAMLEEGSELVFSLTEPMNLLPTRN